MTKAKSTTEGFFKRHPIILHLLLATGFLAFLLILTMFWLNVYTNHGQKIEMPNLTDMELREAQKVTHKKTFELIITDSIFIIGKKGGLNLN